MKGVYFVMHLVLLDSVTPNETPYAQCFQQSFRIKCHQLLAFHVRLILATEETQFKSDMHESFKIEVC
jgi:hypothetical protein